MKMSTLEWARNVAIGLDQLANTIVRGYPDETLSARAGRLIHRWPYKPYAFVVDLMFYPFQGPNHCVNAHKKELTGYHSPPGTPAERDAAKGIKP